MEQCSNRKNGEQCPNRALIGKRYCNSCDILIGTTTKTGKLRAYRLTKWQDRLEAFNGDNNIKCLMNEIGIARITLEGVMNSCQTENDLLANSHRIGDLTTRIEKLIASCHKIEKSSNMLLDKSSVLKLAGDIIGILGRHIPDEKIVEAIADDIVSAIANTENADD